MYDDPQQYHFEPVRRERANEELPRTDGGQSQLNAWSEENEWRVAIIQQRALELVNEQQCIIHCKLKHVSLNMFKMNPFVMNTFLG